MNDVDFDSLNWNKSSYSNYNGSCVEVAMDGIHSDTVYVRDTKQNGTGPVLSFTRNEWNAFVLGVKNNEFSI